MADSDHTRVCPAVTRRTMLSGTFAAAALPLQGSTAAAEIPAGTDSCDPALALWREYHAACRTTEMLCRKQQRLEFALIERIGFPCARVHLPDDGERFTVYSLRQFDEIVGGDPAAAAIRARAAADLAAHQARWEAADEKSGYSATRQAEASARAQDLADRLAATPAATLAGVAGKLDAILWEGETWEDGSQFPWPQVRAALADLKRIGAEQAPGAFMPGRDVPYRRKHRHECCFRVEPMPAGTGR